MDVACQRYLSEGKAMNSKGLISRGLIAAGIGLTAVGVAAGVAHADPVFPVPPPPVPPPAPVVDMAAVVPPAVPVAPAPAVAVPAVPAAPGPAGNFAADYVDDLANNGYGGFGGYSATDALALGYAVCGAGMEWDDQVAAVQRTAASPISERDAKFIVQSAHIYLC